MKNLFSLDDKVAIVTGCSRGIGSVAAKILKTYGARVYGFGRTAQPEFSDIFSEYRSIDIQDDLKIKNFYKKIHENEGKIDILVNSAGVSFPVSMYAQSIERFVETLNINLIGTMKSCEMVLPYMALGKAGSIINITSVAAGLGFPGNPGYVASKGGVAAYSRALAVDYGHLGIRINNIAPGYFATEMTKASYENPVANADRRKRTLLNRWGEPGDISGAVVFLASDASCYITGIDLYVDGGWSVKGL
jgi:NAD(P)-dependent dehydrogenase (short-subunit alcohol dehydrogenase family)